MATLELYINQAVGGPNRFIKVVGTRREELDFTSSNIDQMLEHAVSLLQSDAEYEGRMRIYDIGRRMVAGGDGNAWVTLQKLELWTQPKGEREPQVNEAILGKRVG